MKKTKYLLITIIILCLAYYFFDLEGFLFGLFGVGAVGTNKFTKAQNDLAKKQKELEEEVSNLDKKEPVKDLSPEEEEDYWKKQ